MSKSARVRAKPRRLVWLGASLVCGLSAIAFVLWVVSRWFLSTPVDPLELHSKASPTLPVSTSLISGAPSDDSPTGRLRAEALATAQELVRELPQNPHAICLLGTVHHRNSNEREAIRLWEQCLAIDSNFADAHHALGLWALQKGDFDLAAKHLLQAFRIDPNWEEVPVPLAQALCNQGQAKQAIEVLEVYARSHLDAAEAWIQLGRAHQQAEQFADAQRCFEHVLERTPDSDDAIYGIALALRAQGKTKEAQVRFEQFWQRSQQHDQAVRSQRAARRDDDRLLSLAVQAHLTAARVLQLHGRPQDACRHWERVVALDPAERESREMLVTLHSSGQNWKRAAAVQKQLCQLTPNDPAAWIRHGRLSLQNRDFAEAQDALQRAIELAPDRAEGYALLAQVEMLPGRDSSRAVELARRAVEADPSAANHYILGTAHWHAGNIDDSRVSLQRAVALEPDNAEFRDSYSQVLRSSRP
jgi:tetratricopeptide (TPR) repeat protein